MSNQNDPIAITKEDYEWLASFRSALRGFLAFSERSAHEVGLTAQHHQALLAIVGVTGRDRLTVGELAQRLIIRQHSAVGLANRLQAMKLIRREQDGADHRRIFLCLTEQGRSVLAKLSIAHRLEIDRLAPDLITLLQASGRPGLSPTPTG